MARGSIRDGALSMWHSWRDVTPLRRSATFFLCATFTLYWITQSITSSMRDYWDNRWHRVDPSYVSAPAFGVFAHQTVPEGELPRSYLERLIQHPALDSVSTRRVPRPGCISLLTYWPRNIVASGESDDGKEKDRVKV